jgi:hypothetical protein
MNALRHSLLVVSIGIGLAVLGASSLVSGASAQPPTPTAEQRARARELYGEGQRQFAAHAYTEALAAFEGAYAQVPNPVVLLGVASAQEQLGQRVEARATLERYLRERADAPDRAEISARIAALPSGPVAVAPPATGTIHVACTPSGAAIELDGHAAGTSPTDLTVPAGPHELRLTLAGYAPISRTVAVTAGSTVDVSVELASEADVAAVGTDTSDEMSEDAAFGDEGDESGDEAEEATPPEEAPVSTDPSAGVWVTTAIAGVALVTGTVFGFLALSRQSDFDAMPTRAAADEGEAFALVADLSFGIAAAAGITAIVLYATERPSAPAADTTAASLRFVPVASPTGGGAVISASF